MPKLLSTNWQQDRSLCNCLGSCPCFVMCVPCVLFFICNTFKLEEALRCKPEGRGFDSRWCQWYSSLTSGAGIDSTSNRNEYQEYFLGGNGGRCWQPYHLLVLIVLKCGSLSLLEPHGAVQVCTGIALPFVLSLTFRWTVFINYVAASHKTLHLRYNRWLLFREIISKVVRISRNAWIALCGENYRYFEY